MIAILDYGMGNLYSIRNAFEKIGAEAKIVRDAKGLKQADGIVIPGVGSFDECMKNLSPYTETVKDLIGSGTPIMGICLGMQVLFDSSEEGKEKGFGIIPGKVVKLPKTVIIPQIGWNELKIKKHIKLLDGISEGDFFYFVHSYHCVPKDKQVTAATIDYGKEVVAAIAHDNICAFQFHPEKSGPKGLTILSNFVGDVKC
jgi:glutamine amidotransferase